MRLSKQEIDTLGTYNSEVMRGIMHTTEWHRQMQNLQRIFDAEYQDMRLRDMATRQRDAAPATGEGGAI